MGPVPTFKGFSRNTVSFFRNLEANNTKVWFDAHRTQYDRYVVEPSRDFVFALGKRLVRIAGRVIADPRVNRSLFRINRDTRFSKDKSPYKTNLGIWFWEGHLKRMACSGFYFHLSPAELMLGVGIYRFPKEMLGTYRDTVVDPKYGPPLTRAAARVEKEGYIIGGTHYKKTPRDYDPEHLNARFLLHHGLFAFVETRIPREFYSSDLIDFCYDHYKRMLPIHKWLLAMTDRNASEI